jgi:hypothetical protein
VTRDDDDDDDDNDNNNNNNNNNVINSRNMYEYEAMGKHEGDEKRLQNYGRKTSREETI